MKKLILLALFASTAYAEKQTCVLTADREGNHVTINISNCVTDAPDDPVFVAPSFSGVSEAGSYEVLDKPAGFGSQNSKLRVSYTLDTAGRYGLFSSDLRGNGEGHIELTMLTDGRLYLRMQGGGVLEQELWSNAAAVGGPQDVEVVFTESNVELWLNGNMEASSTTLYDHGSNGLPLVIGGSCQSCTSGANRVKWAAPVPVLVELYGAP